jgi:small subunit ribosomal protein S17e
VRTEQIKRVAKELMERFPDKFSNSFEDNKRMVSNLVKGTTTTVRNQIAGYITHALAGTQTEPSPEETTEEEK